MAEASLLPTDAVCMGKMVLVNEDAAAEVRAGFDGSRNGGYLRLRQTQCLLLYLVILLRQYNSTIPAPK